MNLKQFSVLIFFIMFIYSGINKIFLFQKKVNTLQKKTKLPLILNKFGMICVIILEIIGSIIIISNAMNIISLPVTLVKFVYLLFLIFLIVVTLLYHPPNAKFMIPFLSNLTTFGGLLYLFSDIN